MYPLLYLMLLTGSCLAHYRGSYDTRNVLIVREEPFPEDGVEIECPVCELVTDESDWQGDNEKCHKRGNKAYKKCKHGTYVNKVCGNRLDCYVGLAEPCTVKRDFDLYGKQCAPGLYCNKSLGLCTGPGFSPDSSSQTQLKHYPYTWRRSDPNPKEQSLDLKYYVL